jgi:mannose-6-phosphate isomerase-like protein (cupin superfamily)
MTIDLIDQASLPGGNLEGYLFGATVSVILERAQREGGGPRLHRHPYDETFVIYSGAALFTIGAEQIVARAGQILIAPALTPHRFATIGDYAAHHVHANDRFVTEWLE